MTSEEELEDLHSRRQSLQDLLRSAGWGFLKEILTEQVRGREKEELAYDISSSADLYELVRLKAERRAMLLVLDLPATIVESLSEDLKERETENAT